MQAYDLQHHGPRNWRRLRRYLSRRQRPEFALRTAAARVRFHVQSAKKKNVQIYIQHDTHTYIHTHMYMTPTLLFDPFQVVESLDPLGRWPSFLRPIFCRKLLKSYIESAGRDSAVETSRVFLETGNDSAGCSFCDVMKMSFFPELIYLQ